MQDLVIDWELGSKLAGDNLEFAQKILALLIRDLPTDLLEMKTMYSTNNYEELGRRVHKLHGALCYCGTPRLRSAAAALEIALQKKDNTQLSIVLAQFEFQVDQLLRQAKFFYNQQNQI
jgi:two-component system sensor histidine kinase BarA